MVIYLSHPKHGMKVAVSEMEANEDIRNGWTRVDISKSVVAKEVKEPVEDELHCDGERAELTKQYVDKFGSKPHWKMSLESIKEKLCQQPST